ncbi:MAG: hypothetical protein QNK03_27790 [Myxococcota bacterium]|nr:hypothetical protein [Myxococcota bacterium]
MRSLGSPLSPALAIIALVIGTLAVGPVLGCAAPGQVAPLAAYRYFEAPDPADPWSAKIAGWQVRERRTESDALAPVAEAGPGLHEGDGQALRDKYIAFRQDRRRAMARELAGWIQDQARAHYVPDGTFDHWATLDETLDANGDDCDGLELLVFHSLRDLGADRVFRAIVVRPSDGQHHMVTLWFEDPQDPWVIDPTGAMVSGMPRMSEVPEWQPLKLFTESEEFTVRKASWP